jgi:phosphopentomutase
MSKKTDNQHELDMMAASYKSDQLKLQASQTLATTAESQAEFTAAVAALQEASKGQSTLTGSKIIDGINALVRPGVTYIVFFMWTTVKLATLVYTVHESPDLAGFVQNLHTWWGAEDQAMLANILNFWFMGRVFDKALK